MSIRSVMEEKFGAETLKKSPVHKHELYGLLDQISDTLKSICERVSALEMGGIRYSGSWQRSMSYRKGHVVTHGGGMFTAVMDVGEGVTPGKSDAWQLSAKTGGEGVLTTIDLKLKRQIEAAEDAAERAVEAAAASAKAAAARAEASATAKKRVEVVRVVEHDAVGRIARFEKVIEERDP